MRARTLLLLAILVVGALPGVARADCAGPWLVLGDDPTAAGAALRVHGEGFASECDDVQVGCLPMPSPAPERDIRLELSDEEGTIASATVDADRDHRFTAVLQLPADLAPGTYELVAVTPGWGAIEPVEVNVVAP